ncbi:MAG: CoA transferase [Candidatus Rokubacteria bacterium]|nr:CoA transferase [Candidatus Rokubacteria bacterium]
MAVGGSPGALADVTVLDLTHFLAGPYCSMLLADLGADVIKIEEPGEGDPTRHVPPGYVNGETPYTLTMSRNKRGMTLDLKRAAGRQVFYRMVEKADVVVDNFRPGVTERLAVHYDALKGINPRIICCSITAYGHTGPYRHKAGYEHVVQALGGSMSVTGEPGGPPVKSGLSFIDYSTGVFAAFAVAAALNARRLTGHGQWIDVSLFDVQISMLGYHVSNYFSLGAIPGPEPGSSHPYFVPFQRFRTADGYIILVAVTDRFFRSLCEVLGMAEMAEDARFVGADNRFAHREELIARIQDALLARRTAEWLAVLDAAGIPAAPVNDVAQALADPQVAARRMVVTVDHPLCGPVKIAGNPVKMTGTPGEEFRPAPLLGQHTEEILYDMLGLTKEDVAALRHAGAV